MLQGMNKTLLLLLLVPFTALSAAAMWQHGYFGIWAVAFQSLAGAQVMADLIIALCLFIAWMWRDARALGRNPWPWLALTLVSGSFGPLLYLLSRRADPARTT